MNDTQPSPAFPPMLADWVEKDRELRRLAEEVLPLNKIALFDALAAAGIEIVTVVFDGCGDSGQIEDIEAKAGDLVVALPADQIEIACPVWGGSEIERRTQSVRDAIEASGILQKYPGIDLEKNKVGIFAKLVKLDAPLRDLDRIEIYRPLIADPKAVRKQRAAEGKVMKKGAGELGSEE